MTAMLFIDIQCDVCGTWSEGESSPDVTISKVRRMYRELGWTTYRDGTGILKDRCDKCSKQAKEPKRG